MPRKLLVLLVGNAPTSHTYKVCALTFELKEYLIINIKSLNLYSILIIPLVLTYLIFYKYYIITYNICQDFNLSKLAEINRFRDKPRGGFGYLSLGMAGFEPAELRGLDDDIGLRTNQSSIYYHRKPDALPLRYIPIFYSI